MLHSQTFKKNVKESQRCHVWVKLNKINKIKINAMPSSRDLPNPGIKPASIMSPALAGGFFATNATHPGHPRGLALGNLC